MNSSPSTSSYDSLGMYKRTSFSFATAGEKSGRAIRIKTKRMKREVTPQLSIEERTSVLNLNGVQTTQTLYVVVGGKVERKFISEEGAKSFISLNG